MAHRISATKTLSASNAAIIAGSQVPVSGAALTLVGAGTVVLDTQRRVLLTFGNEAVARTLALTGTDDTGNAISETLAVASGAPGTVASVQDFRSITLAMPAGGGWSAAATLGTNSVGSTPWFILNPHITPFDVGVQTHLVSGAATWTIEVTRERVLSAMGIYNAGQAMTPPVPVPFGWPGLVGLAADATGSINSAVAAVRLTILSGTGTVLADMIQAGITNT